MYRLVPVAPSTDETGGVAVVRVPARHDAVVGRNRERHGCRGVVRHGGLGIPVTRVTVEIAAFDHAEELFLITEIPHTRPIQFSSSASGSSRPE